MRVNITVDTAASWATNKWIAYQHPQITDERKNQIVPITKYNLLVTAFNASTVLLVMAVASTVLFAYAAAVALGAIAVFTRVTTEKELHKYTLPNEPGPARPGQAAQVQPPRADLQQAQGNQANQAGPDHAAPGALPPPVPNPGANLGAQLWNRVRDAISPLSLLRHALNTAPQQEKEDNIFQRLGTRRPENWVENEVYIFDYAVWKNTVPVPEAPAATTAPRVDVAR